MNNPPKYRRFLKKPSGATDFKEFIKTYYSIGHKPLLEIDIDLEEE